MTVAILAMFMSSPVIRQSLREVEVRSEVSESGVQASRQDKREGG